MPSEKKAPSVSKPDGVKMNKAAPKKSAEKVIKYSDKSGGQPELVPIFENIKGMMKPYVKGTLVEQDGEGGMYGLVSKKEIEVEGRKKPEVYFAGLLVQKGYVGFYFMPIYMNNDAEKIVKPELMKCLKGKTCFHIKKNDPLIMDQIKEALDKGYEAYKKRGWV